MHRLKSPLVALIAILVLVGPLFGRVSQIDPFDPYQISTPSAWHRSQGMAEESVSVNLEFIHSSYPADGSRFPVRHLEDQSLLFGESRLLSLDNETLTVNWDIEMPIWADNTQRSDVLYGLTGEESRHVIVSNDYTHLMVDIDLGQISWMQDKTNTNTSAEYTVINEGLLLHATRNNYDSYDYQIVDAHTGDFVTTVSSDGSVSYRSYDGMSIIYGLWEVFAISADTGERLWTYPVTNEDNVRIGETKTLIGRDEEILALDSSTGEELWLLYVKPNYWISWSNPPVAHLVYDNEAVSVDMETGLELHTQPGHRFLSVPENDRFVVVDDSGLALINPRTGEEAWRIAEVTEIWDYRSNYGGDEDLFIIQTEPSGAVVVDMNTGDLLQNQTGNITGLWGDKGIVWHSETEVGLLSPLDGSPLWNYVSPEPLESVESTGQYLVVITASNIVWLDNATGEVQQENARLPAWDDVRPTGLLLLIVIGDQVILRDVGANTEWLLADVDIEQDISWSFQDRYHRLSIYGSTNSQFWLYDLTEGHMVWAEVPADDVSSLSADGRMLVYRGDYRGGTVSLLAPDGTVAWEVDIADNVTNLRRYGDVGTVLVVTDSGAMALSDATGREIFQTPKIPDLSLSPFMFAPGKVFEPGWEISRIYRTLEAGPEILSEDTVLRGAPNESAIERGEFDSGTIITRTGNEREVNGERWVEVHIEGLPGWVRHADIEDGDPIPVATPVS